jgi:hypothetical protein
VADRDLDRHRDESGRRAVARAPDVAPAHPLLALQQTAGNQAVQRLIAGLSPQGGKDVLPEAIADPQEQAVDAVARDQGGREGDVVERRDQARTLLRNGNGSDAADAGTAPTLAKKTVSGPTSEKHGGFKWVVQWELDKLSPKGGVIIQKVNAVHDIKSKDGAKLGTGFDKWAPYWEAWEIKNGQKVTTYAETGDLEDDTFSKGPSPEGSQGVFEEKGTAAFYEGAKLPASMKPERKSPAGILPFSQSDPGVVGGSSSLAHELKATWDGVKADGTTTVTTV